MPITPMVSALMATADRRAFVPRAINCFLAQTMEDAELVILDDGDDPIIDLVPSDPRIRYILDQRRPVGEKFGRLVEEARGEYLVMFDDDDWHGPERLARQAAALEAGAEICLLERFYGYDAAFDRAVQWDWRRFGAFADGTAMFTRDYYRWGSPFSAAEPHPTQAMIRARAAAAAWIGGEELYVQHLHATNLATRQMRGPGWVDVPELVAEIRARLGVQQPAIQASPSPATSSTHVAKVTSSGKVKPKRSSLAVPAPPPRLSKEERRRRRVLASELAGAERRSAAAAPSSRSARVPDPPIEPSVPPAPPPPPASDPPVVLGPHVRFNRPKPTRGVAGRASRAAARARD